MFFGDSDVLYEKSNYGYDKKSGVWQADKDDYDRAGAAWSGIGLAINYIFNWQIAKKLTKGWFYEKKGRYSEAIECYKETINGYNKLFNEAKKIPDEKVIDLVQLIIPTWNLFVGWHWLVGASYNDEKIGGATRAYFMHEINAQKKVIEDRIQMCKGKARR